MATRSVGRHKNIPCPVRVVCPGNPLGVQGCGSFKELFRRNNTLLQLDLTGAVPLYPSPRCPFSHVPQTPRIYQYEFVHAYAHAYRHVYPHGNVHSPWHAAIILFPLLPCVCCREWHWQRRRSQDRGGPGDCQGPDLSEPVRYHGTFTPASTFVQSQTRTPAHPSRPMHPFPLNTLYLTPLPSLFLPFHLHGCVVGVCWEPLFFLYIGFIP